MPDLPLSDNSSCPSTQFFGSGAPHYIRVPCSCSRSREPLPLFPDGDHSSRRGEVCGACSFTSFLRTLDHNLQPRHDSQRMATTSTLPLELTRTVLLSKLASHPTSPTSATTPPPSYDLTDLRTLVHSFLASRDVDRPRWRSSFLRTFRLIATAVAEAGEGEDEVTLFIRVLPVGLRSLLVDRVRGWMLEYVLVETLEFLKEARRVSRRTRSAHGPRIFR